jgi:hypothetical protein
VADAARVRFLVRLPGRLLVRFLGVAAAGGFVTAPALAADAPVAPAAKAAAVQPAPAANVAPVDPEFLEFLGSDDVEAELQSYVAEREPAKGPARGGSAGK